MVTKTETRTTEETKHRWYCDICGKEMIMGCSKHTCGICGRDICSGCAHEVGGYYYHYCLHCWEIGKPYCAQFEQERERHYAVIGAIMCEWKLAAGVRK